MLGLNKRGINSDTPVIYYYVSEVIQLHCHILFQSGQIDYLCQIGLYYVVEFTFRLL